MRDYIGSGHIAAIMNMTKWSNPVKAFLELTEEGHEIELNRQMKAGIFFESGIAAWWADENKKNVVKADLVKIYGKPYLGATPDYYVTGPDGIEAILELKNTHDRNRSKWEDDAPDYYVIQLIWQMHVTGIHKGFLCACIGGQELSHDGRGLEVNYDAEIGAMLEAKATKFWHDHIVPKICPPLRMADSETLAVMFKSITRGKQLTSAISSKDFAEYDKWRADKAELEDKIQKFKIRVKGEIQDAEFAISNDLKWKIKRSKVFVKGHTTEDRTDDRLSIKPTTEKERQILEGAIKNEQRLN